MRRVKSEQSVADLETKTLCTAVIAKHCLALGTQATRRGDVLGPRFGSQLAAAVSAARTEAKTQVFRELSECVVDSEDLPVGISQEALQKNDMFESEHEKHSEKMFRRVCRQFQEEG